MLGRSLSPLNQPADSDVCTIMSRTRSGCMRRSVVIVGYALGAASCASHDPSAAGNVAAAPTSVVTAATSPSLSDSTGAQSQTIPDGRVLIAPEGPYVAGQEVSLLVDDDELIDLYNSAPRLCARIGGAEEVCDPGWIASRPLPSPPSGAQGVVVELPRWHFGPDGDNDCGDFANECRVLWLTETRQLLSSPTLVYDGHLEDRSVALDVSTGNEPGTVTLRTRGVDPTALAEEVFSDLEMRIIEESIEPIAAFNTDDLNLTWEVGGLCGFGSGTPPIGSEKLVDPASWWFPLPIQQPVAHSVGQSVLDSFYGPTCDGGAIKGQRQVSDDEPTVLDLRRSIYGHGGWIDCAVARCYLEVIVRSLYPLADGSSLGSYTTVARVEVDVSDDWPSTRPSISIAEPGPYRPGQTVTVEVRDYDAEAGPGIAWCLGGDSHCGYEFVTSTDGVHRATWVLPSSSSACPPNRCYFAIDSQSEGGAPPAIVIVNLSD